MAILAASAPRRRTVPSSSLRECQILTDAAGARNQDRALPGVRTACAKPDNKNADPNPSNRIMGTAFCMSFNARAFSRYATPHKPASAMVVASGAQLAPTSKSASRTTCRQNISRSSAWRVLVGQSVPNSIRWRLDQPDIARAYDLTPSGPEPDCGVRVAIAIPTHANATKPNPVFFEASMLAPFRVRNIEFAMQRS